VCGALGHLTLILNRGANALNLPLIKKILDKSLGIAINFPLLFAIAIAIVRSAITIWRAIQKRSHEPIYKPDTKNEAKTLRAQLLLLQS
jgi:hypothetical protein